MVYSNANLFADAGKMKGRLRLPGNQKTHQLTKVWESMCLWIVDTLQQGKGVKLPNFGNFSYEQTLSLYDNRVEKRRPVFMLDDSFSKAYSLKYKDSVIPRVLVAMEAINYTKIAIRYSKSLLKDTVFTGLRDIFQQLGKAMVKYDKIKIHFNDVGTLNVRQRKISFSFEPRWHLMDEQYIGEQLAVKEGNRNDEEDETVSLSEEIDVGEEKYSEDVGKNSSKEKYDAEEKEADVRCEESKEIEEYEGDDIRPENATEDSESEGCCSDDDDCSLCYLEKLKEQYLQRGIPFLDLSETENDISENQEVDRRTNEMGIFRPPVPCSSGSFLFAAEKQDVKLAKALLPGEKEVEKMAFERHQCETKALIESEEKCTLDNEKERLEQEEKHQQRLIGFNREQKRLQRFIQEQMKLKKKNDQHDEEYRRSMIAAFPQNQPDDSEDPMVKQDNSKFRQYLQKQMRDKRDRKVKDRSQNLIFERKFLEAVTDEYTRSKICKQELERKVSKDLQKIWATERNHRQNVKDKLHKATRARLQQQNKRPSTAGSIGFDMRQI